MKRFADLFAAIDRSTKTNEKLDALVSYFQKAPPSDAAWALYFLIGNTVARPTGSKLMREWVSESTKIPLWLLEECYNIVGDLAETFSLLIPPHPAGTSLTLSELVETKLIPLSLIEESQRKIALFELWSTMDSRQIFLLFKLITGSLRVGVQKTLLSRALAEISKLPQSQIAHRLMGSFKPTVEAFEKLIDPALSEKDPGHPYPFCLAYPLEFELEFLGQPSDWSVEWKWDGIRAQSISRKGVKLLWSRGEEVITEMFPEIIESFVSLPEGTVLDGEIVAWDGKQPLSFNTLQKRLGRKKVSKEMIQKIPTHFLAYDLLEFEGKDIRELPYTVRREKLAEILLKLNLPRASISPQLKYSSWKELVEIRNGTRQARAEGFMLKANQSAYGVGRKKGLWWKWKLEPYTCDAVLIYAQRGHGRRAGLFTDYTFAVWKGEELVPVAKAYSGLTDKEFNEVNRFIKDHTIERFGPVVSVTPELVFELAFDNIQISSRHKAGLALRFPRMNRMRSDKTFKDADTIESLRSLVSSP